MLSFGVKASHAARAAHAAQEDTGMVSQPTSELQGELATVPQPSPTDSYGRVLYSPLEIAVNAQINSDYNMSYNYHAMHSYFARESVGLPGFAHFFKAMSDESREHAHKLMHYQTVRGRRIQLQVLPQARTPMLASLPLLSLVLSPDMSGCAYYNRTDHV